MRGEGVTSGEPEPLAATAFDLTITVDRNLEYQQSFDGLSLAVIVAHAPSNDIAVLRLLMPAVFTAIAQAGAVTHVGKE